MKTNMEIYFLSLIAIFTLFLLGACGQQSVQNPIFGQSTKKRKQMFVLH